MEFTLSAPPTPSPSTHWDTFVSLCLIMAVFALLVGPPLLLWLRGSRGDARDVLRLSPTPTLQVGASQHLRERLGWLLPTLGLFITLVIVNAGSCSVASLVEERNHYTPMRWDPENDTVNPEWVAFGLTGLVFLYVPLFSVRRPSAARSVLRSPSPSPPSRRRAGR